MSERLSILVPFQSKDPLRIEHWDWLHSYWKAQLPDAEIVIGKDRRSHKRFRNLPFSKSAAVNDAFRHSTGDVIAIVDADAYLDAAVLTHCADRIRLAQCHGIHLWFVPYLHLYRLREDITEDIIHSNPASPLRLSSPPPRADVEGFDASGWGHPFGAMVQVMPRQAFISVGGMDPRFRGWGGEDSSFLRALDTLWGKHQNTANDVLHLWHPKIPSGPSQNPDSMDWKLRMWEGQTQSRANDWLSKQYHQATGDPAAMRQLVDGGHCV